MQAGVGTPYLLAGLFSAFAMTRPRLTLFNRTTILAGLTATMTYLRGGRFRPRTLSANQLSSTAPRAKAAAPPKELTVLSHNLWGSFFMGGPRFEERLRLFMTEVDRYDVVLLQEMFVFADFTTSFGPMSFHLPIQWFISAMKEKGFHYSSNVMAGTPHFGQNHGLLICSRYPLRNITEAAFESRRQLSHKGYLIADLDLGSNRTVTVATTHVEHEKEDMKEAQFEELFRVLKARKPANLVLSGDFNTSPGIPELTGSLKKLNGLAAESGLTDLFPGDMGGTYRAEIKKTKKTSVENPVLSLDHMFISEELSRAEPKVHPLVDIRGDTSRNQPPYASDHLGLAATIRVPEV